MKSVAAPPMVPFREVRHFQADDCLHYETIAVRGQLHDWTIPAHRHQGLHQIHWLAAGAVEANIDGVTQSLSAPAVWMLAPGTVHGFAYARDSAGQQITVPTPALERALASTPNLAARLSHTMILGNTEMGNEAGECERLMEMISREFDQSRPGRAEALTALAALLAIWVLRHGPQAPAALKHQALRDALTHRFRSLIELHFRRHRPLTFYATALGVTVDHLSRVCRATAGVSALDLLHDRLLLEARRQLAYSGASVAAIAEDLGFDDAAYFSRFFARGSGTTPTAYRDALANGRNTPPFQTGIG